jgi:hypothetical protein
MDTLTISHGSHGGKKWEAVGFPRFPPPPIGGGNIGGKFRGNEIAGWQGVEAGFLGTSFEGAGR